MPSKTLIPRIQKVEHRESSKRTTSFTTQQVSQIMKRKMFEKAGWCNKRAVNLWRNKNENTNKKQLKESE